MKDQLADRDQTRDWSLLGILNLRRLGSIHNTKVHKKKQSLIKLLGHTSSAEGWDSNN